MNEQLIEIHEKKKLEDSSYNLGFDDGYNAAVYDLHTKYNKYIENMIRQIQKDFNGRGDVA